MSRQFGFSRNATKTYNVRNMPTSTISSSSVASDAHVDVIRTWLLNRMIDADVRSTLGYAEICRQHVNAHVALVQPLFAAAIGAAAVIPAAHANPAAPGGLDNAHATAIDNFFQALVAPALAAAPAAHPNYGYDVSQHVEPTEAEYNFVEWQFLQALAHSGFTSQGQYNQVISFRVMALPTPPLYYTLEVDEIIDNFPQGVTPFNVGAYFATTIALNAKNAGIVWRWGLVHGCPDAIPWAGFATWEYISRDSKLISQEYVPELRAMSADAIAKKQVVAYVDHDRALDQDYETIEQGIQHMNIKHERNRSRRADLERKRKGLSRKKYRRGEGSDDESNGDSTYFRSQ